VRGVPGNWYPYRDPHKPLVWYKSFLYQAASWKTARRVVAKVEFHFGELFPRVGFIVTNLAKLPHFLGPDPLFSMV